MLLQNLRGQQVRPSFHPRPLYHSPVVVEERKIDLDSMCGVVVDERTGKLCMRSIACKTHSIRLKKLVVGRSKDYQDLLAEYQNGRASVTITRSKGEEERRASKSDADSSIDFAMDIVLVPKSDSRAHNQSQDSMDYSLSHPLNTSSSKGRVKTITLAPQRPVPSLGLFKLDKFPFTFNRSYRLLAYYSRYRNKRIRHDSDYDNLTDPVSHFSVMPAYFVLHSKDSTSKTPTLVSYVRNKMPVNWDDDLPAIPSSRFEDLRIAPMDVTWIRSNSKPQNSDGAFPLDSFVNCVADSTCRRHE